MCFFAAKRKGFPVLRNQSKCTVSETVVIGPWISLVLKTAGSAILTGFQHLPANAVSKQPRDYSIFSCSVSSVFVFFYPKIYLSLSAASILSSHNTSANYRNQIQGCDIKMENSNNLRVRSAWQAHIKKK